MVAASYIDGCLAHEVQCMEVELRMKTRDNQKLRKENARMRQDLRAFAADINIRCGMIEVLEKQVDRLNESFALYRAEHGDPGPTVHGFDEGQPYP